jgi:hypothetical protein
MADLPLAQDGATVVPIDSKYKREQVVMKLVEEFSETEGHVSFDFPSGRFIIDTKGNAKMYEPLRLAAYAIVKRMQDGGVPLCLNIVRDDHTTGLLIYTVRPMYERWPH